MALRVDVEVRIYQVGRGTGAVLMGQSQSNNPGIGQAAGPGSLGNAQFKYLQDGEQVPGTAGSTTLANIKTALDAAATSLAGSSGTPLITPAILAEINAWNSGTP